MLLRKFGIQHKSRHKSTIETSGGTELNNRGSQLSDHIKSLCSQQSVIQQLQKR